MLKRIIHPSVFLVMFVTLLRLNLSKLQHKYLLRTADAIAERQWVEAPDVSAVADKVWYPY